MNHAGLSPEWRRSSTSARRRRWWTTWAIVAGLGAAWALASPLFAGPDEPAHAIRAASVARAQLIGETRPDVEDFVRYVSVPDLLRSGPDVVCYAGKHEVPADCLTVEGTTALVQVGTPAGRHPPAYYWFAGLPFLLTSSVFGIYLMRLVGVAIVAAFVASALASFDRVGASRIANLGLLFALTPMVLFVAGVVNPSLLETGAGLSLWAGGLVLVHEAASPGAVDGRLVARVGVAAIALTLSRALSPLWIGVIGVTLLLVGSRGGLRRLLRSPLIWMWGAGLAVALAAQTGWVVVVGTLNVSDDLAFTGSFSETLRLSAGKQFVLLRQMIGYFGWLDTPAPALTTVLWVVAVGTLVVLAVSVGNRRHAIAAIGIAGLAVLIPFVLDAYQAPNSGFVWQGRYTLPLAVGVPILAAFAIAIGPLGKLIDASRLRPVLAVVFTTAQIAAFAQHLRRNTVGYNGTLLFWKDPVWSPPVPVWVLLGSFTILIVAFAIHAVGRTPITAPVDRVPAEPGG